MVNWGKVNTPFSKATENVRPALVGLAEKVCDQIAGLPRGSLRRVHQIRVLVKRLRALLRLTRGHLPPRTFYRIDHLARRIKNALGNARDHAVLADFVGKLWAPPEKRRLVRALALGKARATARADMLTRKQAILQDAKLLLAQLHRAGGRLRALPAGKGAIATTGAACAQSARVCSKRRADDAEFHRWRKKLKTLIYQTEYLDGNAVSSPRLRQMKHLGHLLGAHHDLALMQLRMNDHAIEKKLIQHIARKKDALARRTLKQAARIFPKL